jgi:hypothetical protein
MPWGSDAGPTSENDFGRDPHFYRPGVMGLVTTRRILPTCENLAGVPLSAATTGSKLSADLADSPQIHDSYPVNGEGLLTPAILSHEENLRPPMPRSRRRTPVPIRAESSAARVNATGAS